MSLSAEVERAVDACMTAMIEERELTCPQMCDVAIGLLGSLKHLLSRISRHPAVFQDEQAMEISFHEFEMQISDIRRDLTEDQ